MNNSLAVSIYVFVVVFTFLTAVVCAVRLLVKAGARLASRRPPAPRRSAPSVPAVPWRDAPSRWHKTSEEYLAPPPRPRDEEEYHRASDYVLDPNSPYAISTPPRREEDRW